MPSPRPPPTTPAAVPPESPRFITVPEPRQSSDEKAARLKGVLPVPRQIFSNREDNRKVDPEHLERVMPLSAAERAGLPPRSEEEARHRVSAARRREVLAEGLQGLWARKRVHDKRATARSAKHRAANLAAATAPDSLDDILTRGTVRAATAIDTAVRLDPKRLERAEEARARHEAAIALKSEARRDALAQLYVTAGSFIVDEAELEAKVSRIFTEDHFRYDSVDRGSSIWDSGSPPITVAELRAEMAGNSPNVTTVTANRSVAAKTTARQKTVAEELTGGKL